jgi:pimeloyl-ACP methyl ester carboxylesterase
VQKLIIFILGRYLNTINLLSKKVGGKHAFLLFCYPFPVKLKPVQEKFLDTSERSFTCFEGKKIATYKWGSGPHTILCLHGWQSQTYRWKKYIEHLDKEKYTIISIDAPAHGNSEGKIFNVPMYARLVEQMMQENDVTYILAHSLGAFSTMCLFHEKPNLALAKVALLGTPGEATEFIDGYARILKTHPRVKKNLKDYFMSYAGLKPSYYSTIRFAPSQTSEALLIHDTDDKEAPYHHAQKIETLWQNATLHTTTGFGHKLRDISVVNKVVAFFED